MSGALTNGESQNEFQEARHNFLYTKRQLNIEVHAEYYKNSWEQVPHSMLITI